MKIVHYVAGLVHWRDPKYQFCHSLFLDQFCRGAQVQLISVLSALQKKVQYFETLKQKFEWHHLVAKCATYAGGPICATFPTETDAIVAVLTRLTRFALLFTLFSRKILPDQHTSIAMHCLYVQIKVYFAIFIFMLLKITILCPVEGEASCVIGCGSTEVGKPLPVLQVVASQTCLLTSRELSSLGGRHLNAAQPAIIYVCAGPDAVDTLITGPQNKFSFLVVIIWFVSYISPVAPLWAVEGLQLG